MTNVPGWLGALGALFGILVLVAAATAVIWSTAAQKRAEALESTNEALDTRVKLLEKDKIELQAERKALVERVHVLEDIVTSKKELEHLQATLDAHDRRVDGINLMIQNNHKEEMLRLGENRDMLDKIHRQNVLTRQALNKSGRTVSIEGEEDGRNA